MYEYTGMDNELRTPLRLHAVPMITKDFPRLIGELYLQRAWWLVCLDSWTCLSKRLQKYTKGCCFNKSMYNPNPDRAQRAGTIQTPGPQIQTEKMIPAIQIRYCICKLNICRQNIDQSKVAMSLMYIYIYITGVAAFWLTKFGGCFHLQKIITDTLNFQLLTKGTNKIHIFDLHLQ